MPDEQPAVGDFLIADDLGERRVALEMERSLLKALQANSVLIGSVCGGEMSCGTCHIYLEPMGGTVNEPPSPAETMLLEDSRHFRPDQSRLACQVKVTPHLVNSRIVVAPDE